MRRRSVLLLISLSALFAAFAALSLAGCGGERAALNMGKGDGVDPAVSPQATTPTAAKFGPIAAYLPPAGTTLKYAVSGMVFGNGKPGNNVTRLKFTSYDNTAGSVTIDRPAAGSLHQKRFILWFKSVNGRSYLWREQVIRFSPDPLPNEVTIFNPGLLIAMFSATAQPVKSSWTQTKNGVTDPTHYSIYQKFLGTSSITVAGHTHTAAISRFTFDPAYAVDMGGFNIYWVKGLGPVSGTIDPVGGILSAVGAKVNVPKWAKLADLSLVGVEH